MKSATLGVARACRGGGVHLHLHGRARCAGGHWRDPWLRAACSVSWPVPTGDSRAPTSQNDLTHSPQLYGGANRAATRLRPPNRRSWARRARGPRAQIQLGLEHANYSPPRPPSRRFLRSGHAACVSSSTGRGGRAGRKQIRREAYARADMWIGIDHRGGSVGGQGGSKGKRGRRRMHPPAVSMAPSSLRRDLHEGSGGSPCTIVERGGRYAGVGGAAHEARRACPPPTA